MRTPEQGFTAKLTIEQREAVGLAMADTNMTARQISKAAKLGQLANFKTGELLEPFVREAAALPGPKDPRPDPPGMGPKQDRTGEAITRGGLAGKILAEHRRAPRNVDGPADGGPVETAE
jgi:hypothetical protein